MTDDSICHQGRSTLTNIILDQRLQYLKGVCGKSMDETVSVVDHRLLGKGLTPDQVWMFFLVSFHLVLSLHSTTTKVNLFVITFLCS